MDREKVIKGLEEISDYFFDIYRKEKNGYSPAQEYCNVAEEAIVLLKEQEAKTGNWIQSNPKFVSAKATGGSRMSTCSNCGKWGRKSFSFCPHCGAKMEFEGR